MLSAQEDGKRPEGSDAAPRLRLVPARADADAERVSPWLSPRMRYVVGVCGALGAWVTMSVGLSVEPLTAFDVVRAVAQGLAVALPVFVGLYALQREQTARFARLLVISGLAWAPTILAATDESLPYSIGRTWAWGVNAWIVYLLLTFPTGRLVRAVDRWLAAAAFAVIGLLYLPTVPFAEFPVPSPWTACTGGCPSNAFMISHGTPGFVPTVATARDVLSTLIYAAAAITVATRWARGSHAMRRVHGPVFAFAIANLMAAALFLLARRSGADANVTDMAALVWLMATPILALAFLAGLLRWRFVALGTWRQLTPGDQTRPGAGAIRDVLAEAIRDPSLEIGYWSEDELRWLTDEGRPFALPASGSVRALTEISAQGKPVAVIVHEDSYVVHAAVEEVVQGVAVMALTNQRLEAVAHAKLRELTESRTRIVEAIDKDRRRVERDLHDGAQQRLIALKVAADRGAEVAASSTDRTSELFKRIGDDAEAALEEVRALARGIYPPLLVDHGLVEALGDAASRSALRTTVRAREVGRYPQEIESAVYFCCLEAMQNAEKHANARTVSIDLRAGRDLTFEVRDDGNGFKLDAVDSASGLRNMRDRVAAVGGNIHVESAIGSGTLVAGTVPTVAHKVPAEIERLMLRATDALEDPLAIYRAIRTASGTIVDFAVEHVNDAACARTGLVRETQVGKTLAQLDPDYFRSAEFGWHCEALTASGRVVRDEVEYVGPRSTRRIHAAWEIRAVALGADRLAVLWHDITETKRQQRALELRADALAREGTGVCVVRASSGAIVYANPTFEHMFGYGSGELEGRLASDLDVGEWSGGRTPGDEGFEAECRRKDGTTIWCDVVIDGFDDEDLGWCWVSVHREITTRKEQQSEIAAHVAQLERALSHLPGLAYSTDVDLDPRILFNGLGVDPFETTARAQIADVNRRVLITGTGVRTVLDDVVPTGQLMLSVDPLLSDDGSIVGVVGTLLEPAESAEEATLRSLQGGAPAARRLPRRR